MFSEVSDFTVHSIAGGIAGTASAVVTCPLDVLKTRLQASTGSSRGPMLMAKSIWRQEGMRGFWRGVGPQLMGIAPTRALFFGMYGALQSAANGRIPEPYGNLLSTFGASVTAFTVTNPIWMVKTRLQLMPPMHSKAVLVMRDQAMGKAGIEAAGAQLHKHLRAKGVIHRNMLDAASAIYRTEGWRAFFRGTTASYWGVAEKVLYFGMYDPLKKRFCTVPASDHVGGANSDAATLETIPWRTALIAGGCQLIATTVTYPHEVIKTRLREQRGVDIRTAKYQGFLHALRTIYRQEGSRALFSGLSVHLIKSVPNTAITFVLYEGIMEFLERQKKSR